MANENPKLTEEPGDSPRSSRPTGSGFHFRLSAKYPPDGDASGGTFVEGDMECDASDLPELAIRVLTDLVDEWNMEGQTHIEFTISPNAKARNES